ncbi:MAG: holo-ACP synthase [Micrococcales bacterium]
MITGVGVDLVDLVRFESELTKTPKLLERLFHPVERGYKMRQLAASFAAKEAVVKALGSSEGLRWSEISVVRDSLGKPWIQAEGQSAQRLQQAGVAKLHLSLSHDGGMLIAYVIAEGVGALGAGEGGWDA